MTTTVPSPRSVGLDDGPAAAAALASAELRHALGEFGYPSPEARVRFLADGDRLRAVVRIPVDVPWRVSDAAVVRALRQARALHPEVRLDDRRLESTTIRD